jgi:hypothetical protein
MILISCGTSRSRVIWPIPEIRERPEIIFIDCIGPESGRKYICLTVEDQRALFDYLILNEMELLKAVVMIKEINKR